MIKKTSVFEIRKMGGVIVIAVGKMVGIVMKSI